MKEFWFDFFPNFVSDLLAGVILGAIVAIWVTRRQSKDETRKRKRKILQLLKDELKINYQYLDNYKITKNINNHAHELFIHTNLIAEKLIRENWRAFSDGGELQWINDAELLGQLASAYFAIKSVKDTGRDFIKYRYYGEQNYGEVISEELYSQLAKDIEFAKREIENTVKIINSSY